MATGDSGCEAYTAIAWGVGLSHERSDIAGAEGFHSLEGNMCGTAMRGADALPGSKATSRAKGSHRNLGGLVSGRQMLRERDGPHREGEEPKPMMHGREKSDLVIVAMNPANKAKKARCGGICGGGRSGVGGAKGGGQGEYAPAKHVPGTEPDKRDTGAGAYTATVPSHTRGRSRMRESRTYGSGRGACHETHVPTATRRREFIAGLGGAAAWPLAARAQQGDRVRRIGVLMPGDENDPVAKPRLSAFTQALADLGWTDGRNVRMDLRWAGGDINRIRALAQELVGLQPDIILTSATPATVALQRETRTIPIVFANVGDPVASGIVARLDRPSGNITGFANLRSLAGRQVA